MTEENPLVIIEQAVEKAEAKSDAEIIVAFAEMSGPYRDRRMVFALIAAIAVMSFIILSSLNFSSPYLLINGLLTFVAAYGFSIFFPASLGLVTSPERRYNQVKSCSQLTWYRQGVSLTKRRTGILLYVSLLEKEGVLIADAGIRQKVPPAELGRLEVALRHAALKPDPVGAFTEFLTEFGEMLAKYVPEESDNPNELPNAPVWLKGSDLWV